MGEYTVTSYEQLLHLGEEVEEDDSRRTPFLDEEGKATLLIYKPDNVTQLKFKVDESWSLSEIMHYYPPIGWQEVFLSFTGVKLLDNLTTFYPRRKDVFKAFWLTPLNKVKVVLVGQDPYHDRRGNRPTATGCSFSSRKGDACPPSLENIKKRLRAEYKGIALSKKSGDLTPWARQGVLLLNMALTVLPKTPRSHLQNWESFLQHVCKAILEKRPGTIFLLLGQKSRAIEQFLGTKAVVVTAPHPSPLSGGAFVAHPEPIFTKIDELMMENDRDPINWAF